MFDELNNRPTAETDEQYRKRHNERLWKQQLEDDKRREQEIARRRAEWTATPESERLCTQCGLKLDSVTIAKILENPITHRAEHDFCNSIEMESGVVRYLVGQLRETYGDENIPLESVRKVVEVWRQSKGQCAISKIKLAIPSDGVLPTPKYDGSLMSSMDRAVLQHQWNKEQQSKDRQTKLHSPVIDFDLEGKLRLISKTVARWREGLEDSEFADLVRTLNGELHSAFPESRSFNPSAVGRLSMSRLHIR